MNNYNINLIIQHMLVEFSCKEIPHEYAGNYEICQIINIR